MQDDKSYGARCWLGGRLLDEYMQHEAECAECKVVPFPGPPPAPNALTDILSERGRQDAKWGVQRHPLMVWIAVLTEEVGELSEAALHQQFGGHAAGNVREEAIHVAAVALSIVQALDEGRAWSLKDMP